MSLNVRAAHGEGSRKPALLVLDGVAAFCAYFAMYAFRKPFTAAGFDHVGGWNHAIDYKSLLLAAQIAGYALSKMLGMKFIAEMGRRRRAAAIYGLIGASWIALLLLPLVPAPAGIVCLFLNGLPLGMIWGILFNYVEGRRSTELLGSILCASFILSSGMVKSAGMVLLDAGVPELWMPCVTGLLFVPLLILSLWWLERMPPPDARDEAERVRRVPMNRADRLAFLRQCLLPVTLFVGCYLLLTVVRDLRDNFAAEIWHELGYTSMATLFTGSEVPVAIVVLATLAAMTRIRNNLKALMVMHAAILAGAMLLGLSTLAFQAHLLSPVAWMTLSGAGLYLAYTPFNALLFDRLIAVMRQPANAGFLIYVADSAGYAGSCGLLFYKLLAKPKMEWLNIFLYACYFTAIAAILCITASAIYLAARSLRRPARRARRSGQGVQSV